MGAVPTLTRREINRAVLARQGLIERSGSSVPRTLERVAGIQAQYAPSMYVGVWTRMEGLSRDALTRAIERRAAVVGTLMRITIHLVSRADYWPIAIAVRDTRRERWLRVYRREVTADEMERAARLVRERLAGGGTLTARDLAALLGKIPAMGVGLWVDLVRVPPAGTWERRRADIYGLAGDWVGPEPAMSASEAVEHLVRRYLAGFGPASRRDVADFTGLPAAAVAAALAGMRLKTFATEDGEELLDLPRAPRPAASVDVPARFLPTWDATLLVHVRRAGILRAEDRPRIFSTKTPHSLPTFLVDGSVAGTWRYDGDRIELSPWRRLDATTRRSLEAEADALAAFHAE